MTSELFDGGIVPVRIVEDRWVKLDLRIGVPEIVIGSAVGAVIILGPEVIFDFLFKWFGRIAGRLFNTLGDNMPFIIEESFKTFSKVAPKIIGSITDNMGIVIDASLNIFDTAIPKIADVVSKNAGTIAKSLTKVTTNLALQAPDIIAGSVQGVAEGLGDTFKKVFG